MNKFLLSNDVREYLFHNNTSSLLTTTTSTLKSFSCYDDYYCNSAALSYTGHVLLGVIGLLLSLLGLALNVLLIPVLSLVGIRSSATYYMIGMAISDSCLLIVNVMLIVIRYLPSSQIDQLLIYQNFVAYLVPFGSPMKSLCQTLTISLCTCLILDRLVYFRTEMKPNTAKREIAVKVMLIVVTITIICKLPNFLLYKIVENSSLAEISVRWTLLAKSWIFIFDMVLFTIIYGVLVFSSCLLWYLSVTCHFLPKVFLVKLFNVPPTERFQRRERLYIMIGLMVGVGSIILKFSHLLRNIFFGFSSVDRPLSQKHRLAMADMWMEITDLLSIITKPSVYLLFAVHFRQALKDMIGLWVRPSRYTVMKASGGMGKLIDLTTKVDSSIYRSDTSNSLLQYANPESHYKNGYHGVSSTDIEALAAQRVNNSVKLSTNKDSNSSHMSAGSSVSVESSSRSGLKDECLKY